METHLRAMLALLHRTPLLDKPVGFTLHPAIDITPGPGFADGNPVTKRLPLEGLLTMGAIRHTIENGKVRFNDDYTSSFSVIDIWVNSIPAVFDADASDDRNNDWRDSIGRMRAEPKRGADYMGYPTFINAKGQRRVVITNRREPLFIPVERERVLRLFITEDRAALAQPGASGDDPNARYIRNLEESRKGASKAQQAMIDTVLTQYRKRLKEMMPQLDSLGQMNKDLLAAHERLLATMTPADRRAPGAFRADSGRLAFNPFVGPERLQLYQSNPAFFDLTRPRGDVQLMMFDLFDNGESTIAHAEPRFPEYQRRLLDQLDLKALAAFIK